MRAAMCVLTVLRLMQSSSAISLFALPRAAARRTCSSLAESGSTGWAGGARRLAAAKERLADAAGEYGDVVRLLAYTGLRFGEMAALRVRRVDFLRKRLTVAESATEVGGTVEYGTPKTHQQRTVPIPAVLVEPVSRRCEGKGRDDLVLTACRWPAAPTSRRSSGWSATRRQR